MADGLAREGVFRLHTSLKVKYASVCSVCVGSSPLFCFSFLLSWNKTYRNKKKPAMAVFLKVSAIMAVILPLFWSDS